MFYQPKDGHGLPHSPFNAIVSPRPIGWISTRGPQGDNLAPYSYFNAVAYTPPQVIFAGDLKDSIRNIQETGVFQEIDIGEIQYQYGFQMIWKKLFVLVQSKSYKSFQDVEKSMIFTDNLLMILQFLLNKEKES